MEMGEESATRGTGETQAYNGHGKDFKDLVQGCGAGVDTAPLLQFLAPAPGSRNRKVTGTGAGAEPQP